MKNEYNMRIGWDVAKNPNGMYVLIEYQEGFGARKVEELFESRSEYFLRYIILEQLRRDAEECVENLLESFRAPEAYDAEVYKIPQNKINLEEFIERRKNFDRYISDLKKITKYSIPEPEPFVGLSLRNLLDQAKNIMCEDGKGKDEEE